MAFNGGSRPCQDLIGKNTRCPAATRANTPTNRSGLQNILRTATRSAASPSQKPKLALGPLLTSTTVVERREVGWRDVLRKELKPQNRDLARRRSGLRKWYPVAGPEKHSNRELQMPHLTLNGNPTQPDEQYVPVAAPMEMPAAEPERDDPPPEEVPPVSPTEAPLQMPAPSSEPLPCA